MTIKHESVTKIIPMRAFGKARPRVTSKGTFMPKAYKDNCKKLKLLFGYVPEGLVHLSVTVHRAMPQGWSIAKRKQMNGNYAKPKPDIDNIVGAVMDSLFDDDDIVVSIEAKKVWGDKHRMIIEVTEV